jgi:hypothetical protein
MVGYMIVWVFFAALLLLILLLILIQLIRQGIARLRRWWGGAPQHPPDRPAPADAPRQ